MCARRCRAAPSGPASPCSAPTAASTPSSSTTSPGRTLAAVSWTESDLRELKPLEQAAKAGELLAERAKQAGVDSAVFDRGGYRYHGKVKAFADGVREGGLTV